jgi:transcription-repair coupling factor (superfamily II helicase)
MDEATTGAHDTRLEHTAAEVRALACLTTATTLAVGDLVIHFSHGIGRFEGLRSIEAEGCRETIEVAYRDGTLYVPVEEIGLLWRYGTSQTQVKLDPLRSRAWGARKSRVMRRIGAIAQRLIGIAARRVTTNAPRLVAEDDAYRRFAKGFPFDPTPDQAAAIVETARDLASGRPMDRLVCGDVGSGKTEIALRAAFIAASAVIQTAVIVPTTLLARQHADTFCKRFAGFPAAIEVASRLVGKMSPLKRIAEGSVDIAIGTHTLLARGVTFDRLGLLIIDEEHRFGVAHKERLKQLSEGVHVLTLTATPIPRTMQLALSPIRDLSLLLTPPQGRRPIHTTVGPADPAVIKKALEAERTRGGQSFYVCPRISDIEPLYQQIQVALPGLRVAKAHGQLHSRELDRVMGAFGDGEFDVLLSTTIIESGLDIPSANTIVVHDAHRLGLAQLYQLRGRVGRSKTQGYAYLTYPAEENLGIDAKRRLDVLCSLDAVGAGFELANHDMDIRGAGNLVGEEQSGHIRAIGFELFQTLLNKAVAALQRGGPKSWSDVWVPRVDLGLAARLPPSYVQNTDDRTTFYWQLAHLESANAVAMLERDVIAEHGAMPPEASSLFRLARLRCACRELEIAELICGPRGMSLTPRPETRFDERLLAQAKQLGSVRRKRDGRLVIAAGTNETDRWAKVEMLLAIEPRDGRHRDSCLLTPPEPSPNSLVWRKARTSDARPR